MAPLPGLESLPSTYLVYWTPLRVLTEGFGVRAAVAAAGATVALGVLRPPDSARADPRSAAGAGTPTPPSTIPASTTVPDCGRLPRRRAAVRRLLVLWAAAPVVLFALSYLVTPIFTHRYTIAASLACYLPAAAGLAGIRRRHLRYAAAAVVVLGLVAPLPAYYATDQKEQWREATAYVEGNAEPGALVVITSESARLPYRYYAERDGLGVEPVEADAPAWTVESRTAGADVVWFVASHADERTERRFTTTLEERYVLARTEAFGNVVVRRYERRWVPEPEVGGRSRGRLTWPPTSATGASAASAGAADRSRRRRGASLTARPDFRVLDDRRQGGSIPIPRIPRGEQCRPT